MHKLNEWKPAKGLTMSTVWLLWEFSYSSNTKIEFSQTDRICVQMYESNKLCPLLILHLVLNWKKGAISPKRSAAIYKWISFMLDCFIKAFVLTQIEHSWMILSIFPSSLQDNVFHFLETQKSKMSMFSHATSVTDWLPPIFSATNLLLDYQTGTEWHW